MPCVPVGHCVSACMLCVPWVVSNVDIFNHQSEWMLTRRTEQDLEVILLWVGGRGSKGHSSAWGSTCSQLLMFSPSSAF